MVGPGDEIAAGAGGRSPLRALHADREQVIDVLKAAFVQGRLDKDEFDLRVGQVLAAYADLDVLTADIPAGLAAAQPPEPARESNNKKLIARGTGAGAGVTVLLAAAAGVATGNPGVGSILGVVAGSFVAVLLFGFLTFLSWVLGKGFSRHPSQGLPPDASGNAARRLASAGPPSQISHDPQHTAEAAQSRLPRPVRPSVRPPHRWRPLVRRYAMCYPGH
jgi:hypothetical protein